MNSVEALIAESTGLGKKNQPLINIPMHRMMAIPIRLLKTGINL